MALSSGTRLGQYEIGALIGAGGMGEVYRARDTRLHRDVAIKILPASVAADPDRLMRFEREARTLATLNHPHIAQIHGLEESDGVPALRALVMEFVDGEDLSDRIARGPLPVDEAVSIARQIAEALETAHEHGIIHRDLKPGNIKVRPDGTVKVLDFGLAKALTDLGGFASESGSVSLPTVTSPALTMRGTILGTAAYMSPEQAKGKVADKRADIWAFGCICYEMLTGTMLFAGETVSETIAEVLKKNVDLRSLPSATPDCFRRVIHRCLERDPHNRLRDIGDARIELNAPAPPEERRSAARIWWIVWSAAAGIVLLVGASVVVMPLLRGRTTPTGRELKLTFVPSTDLTLTPFGSAGTPNFALSPDGRHIAYIASAPGRAPSLYIQQLESRRAQEIPRSEDASKPFWSADGQSLGFFAEGKLKTIALDGTRPAILATIIDAAGGAWSGDVILVGRELGPIARISATSGRLSDATVLQPSARGHRWPQFLPDGRRFIFTEIGGAVMLASVESTAPADLLGEFGATAVYAYGFLLFVSPTSSKLIAQPVDARSLKPVAAGREVLDQIRYAAGAGYPPVSLSANRLLAYWDGTTVSSQPEWFDRSGNPLPKLSAPSQTHIVAIAPDDRQVAFTRLGPPLSNAPPSIWLMDSAGGAARFSFTRGATSPIWSADGRNILFSSMSNEGATLLIRRPVSAAEKEQVIGTLASSPAVGNIGIGNDRATDWSRDGRTVLVTVINPATGRDIIALDVETGRLTPVIQSTASEIQGRFSPDGRWVAFASNETGRWEVYIESFPKAAARSQVSTDGGSQPIWRRDGAELYFVAPDGKLMAVDVTQGPSFTRGIPRPLFQTRIRPTYPPYPVTYDVTSDGQRFLIDSVRPESGPTVSIIVNWSAATVGNGGNSVPPTESP